MRRKLPARQKRDIGSTLKHSTPEDPAQAFVRQVRAAIEWHLEHGMTTIPVYYQGKRPCGEEWQNTTDSWEAFEPYLASGKPCNVGLLLGGDARVVDVDLDTGTAADLARHFLPPTAYRWGREGHPHSHYLYHCHDGDLKRAAFKGPDGEMIVEIRGDGCQSVIPPSVHECGETIEYVEQGEPATASLADLQVAVGRIAAAALLVEEYPEQGGRNDYVLAMAGWLAHAGWKVEVAQSFIGAIVHEAPDDEFDSRMTTVRGTFEKFDRGEAVTGWPLMAELVGEDVMKTVCRWLAIEAEQGGMTADAAVKLCDQVLELAGSRGKAFVGDLLSDSKKIDNLVDLRTVHPARFSGLLANLTEIPKVSATAVSRLEKGIGNEAKNRRSQPAELPKYRVERGGTYYCAG